MKLRHDLDQARVVAIGQMASVQHSKHQDHMRNTVTDIVLAQVVPIVQRL